MEQNNLEKDDSVKTSIGLVVGSLLCGALLMLLGFFTYNEYKDVHEAVASVPTLETKPQTTTDTKTPTNVDPANNTNPPNVPKSSIIAFTDEDKDVVGRLILKDGVLSFEGALDTSGILFMSYIASQMGLHCDELKEKYPIKQKPATPTPTKK